MTWDLPPLAVIDTETTSLDTSEARIVEVAVVHLDGLNKRPRAALQARVRPGIEIPEAATRIHGIRTADVQDAPSWPEVWHLVAHSCADRLIVAKNAPYDAGVIAAECARYELPPCFGPATGWLCAHVLAHVADRFQRSKRLTEVARRRGISLGPEAAHGALADALTCALVLPRLLRDAATAPCPRGGRDLGAELDYALALCTAADVRPLLGWQLMAGMDLEVDYIEYLKREGRDHGEPPKCPWHELAGKEPPVWKQTDPEPSICPDCGDPIWWHVGRDGRVEARRLGSTEPHICPEIP